MASSAAEPPLTMKRRRSERIQRWRNLEYPIGGFGAGGDWKRRASSGEATAYEIDTERGIVRRRGGEVVSTHKKEYVSISLSINPKRKNFQLHSLVCWAAHGPMPSGCSSVDHIDRDPTNNTASNLRWASAKDQAANRKPSERKAMLPFIQAPGEILCEFRGFPGFSYTGPSLVITTSGRVVRDGKLSTAESMNNSGYPVVGVTGLGSMLTHRAAWSAYYGPGAVVPKVINHRDGNKKNFAMSNLEESDYSHNGFAAHDTGAHDDGKRRRQPVIIKLTKSETAGGAWMYDGVNSAEFPSQSAAARALEASGVCALQDVVAAISSSLRRNISFTVLVDGVPTKAWAFSS
jgi:hypothetical protein